jgi:Zn finger protein HypA/HybF involved in hydrogenase expression
MFPCTAEKVIGFQRLICKNPDCKHLFKTIVFIEGWEKRFAGEMVHKSNGTSYYVCPKCKAKNFVILEGEDILLEKIISYETPKHKPQQKELKKHPRAMDSINRNDAQGFYRKVF